MSENRISEARRAYRKFVEGNMFEEKIILKQNIKSGCILGNEKYVREIRNKYLKENNDDIPQLKYLKNSVSMDEINKRVCDRIMDYKLARQVSIYLSKKYTSKKTIEIANYFKNISSSGINKSYRRMERIRKENSRTDGLIICLEKDICVLP